MDVLQHVEPRTTSLASELPASVATLVAEKAVVAVIATGVRRDDHHRSPGGTEDPMYLREGSLIVGYVLEEVCAQHRVDAPVPEGKLTGIGSQQAGVGDCAVCLAQPTRNQVHPEQSGVGEEVAQVPKKMPGGTTHVYYDGGNGERPEPGEHRAPSPDVDEMRAGVLLVQLLEALRPVDRGSTLDIAEEGGARPVLVQPALVERCERVHSWGGRQSHHRSHHTQVIRLCRTPRGSLLGGLEIQP